MTQMKLELYVTTSLVIHTENNKVYFYIKIPFYRVWHLSVCSNLEVSSLLFESVVATYYPAMH